MLYEQNVRPLKTPVLVIFNFNFYYFLISYLLATWHMGSLFFDQDQTCVPCIGSAREVPRSYFNSLEKDLEICVSCISCTDRQILYQLCHLGSKVITVGINRLSFLGLREI